MEATDKLTICPICSQPHHVCRHFEDMRWENLRLELELFWQHLKAFMVMMVSNYVYACTTDMAVVVQRGVSDRTSLPQLTGMYLQWPEERARPGLIQQVEKLRGWICSVPTNEHIQGQAQQTASLSECTRSVPQNDHTQGLIQQSNSTIPEATPIAEPLPQQQLIPDATPIWDNMPESEPAAVATPVIEAEAVPICSITQEMPEDPAQAQPCQHIFSLEAISQWNARHEAGTAPCPNCRTPIQRIIPMQLRPQPQRPPSRNPSFGSLADLSIFSPQPQPRAAAISEEEREASMSL